MTDTPTPSPERQARDERLHVMLAELEAHRPFFTPEDCARAELCIDDIEGVQADLASAEARAVKAEAQLFERPIYVAAHNAKLPTPGAIDWKTRADDLQRRLDAVEAHLGNLLAVIHRDGGHKQAEVGTEAAVEAAEAEVLRLFAVEARIAGVTAELRKGGIVTAVADYDTHIYNEMAAGAGDTSGQLRAALADGLSRSITEMTVERWATPEWGPPRTVWTLKAYVASAKVIEDMIALLHPQQEADK